MDNKDFSNLGEQIRDSVQDAIDSMDFKQLNKTISTTVNFALEEARDHMVKKPSKAEGPGYRPFQTSYEPRVPQKGELVSVNQTGRVAGILYTVFGSIGLGIMLLVLLAVWILALVAKPVFWAVTGASVFLLAMTVGFGLMLRAGISMNGRIKRARLYMKQAGKRLYCGIEELAVAAGKSKEYVVRDLQKMIKIGTLGKAYLDDQRTCLILGEDSYRQYLESRQALKERERVQALEEQAKKKEAGTLKRNKELEQMMAEGQNYLRILRESNDAIPGEVISNKISQLEDVIRRIFETVSQHPEQMDEMERFMDYYLPTTAKLVTTYRDFDQTGSQGANIASAKAEIEGTLDTINRAFEQLLDDLYQDAALDISTDASVLQTMLKQDGWTGSDFTGGKKHE